MIIYSDLKRLRKERRRLKLVLYEIDKEKKIKFKDDFQYEVDIL